MKTLLITAVASRQAEVQQLLQQAGIVHCTYWEAAGWHMQHTSDATAAWLGHGQPEVPSLVYLAFVTPTQAALWQQQVTALSETDSTSRLHWSVLPSEV